MRPRRSMSLSRKPDFIDCRFQIVDCRLKQCVGGCGFCNLRSEICNLSLFPEKMLEPQPGQTRLGFVASGAAGRGKLLVNHRSRLPFRIVFEKARGVKARLVIPEEFPLRPIGTIFFLDDFVKGRESIFAVTKFFEAYSLFEERLVAPE